MYLKVGQNENVKIFYISLTFNIVEIINMGIN